MTSESSHPVEVFAFLVATAKCRCDDCRITNTVSYSVVMQLSCKEGKRGKAQEHLSGNRMGAFHFLVCFVFVTSIEVQNIFYIYEGGIQMKQYEIRKLKTVWPKGTGHRNTIRTAVYELEMVRYTAESPKLLWTKMGGWQSRYRSRWSDCQNPKSVDGKVADENAFPPAARVPAGSRDENLVSTTFESSVVK